MKYDVMLYGPGGFDVVTVEAEGGDDAAAKAYRAGWHVRAVIPAAVQTDEPKRGRPAKVEG